MRIGSGALRGRKLLPPPGRGTRPITARVKKSLFGMLTGRLDDAMVLDLYCGTGTLGLEALSRGARRCYFAEQNRRVLARLERNLATCGCGESSTIWAGDVERRLAHWLETLPGPVNIAFVDPPYPSARRWDWSRVISRLFAPLAGALAADGVVVLRLPGDVGPPEPLGPLRLQRCRTYGEMTLRLYEP